MNDFNIETLPVKIEYVAEVFRPDWGTNGAKVDQWAVTIGAEWGNKLGQWRTDYFTGLGLRNKIGRPVKPKIADVLHSLFMDAQAADLNFSDWCAEFGYSDDSIKAFNVYRECVQIGVMLRKHFTPDQRDAIQSITAEM